MKILTKTDIEKLVKEIIDFLSEREMEMDVTIYYNDKSLSNAGHKLWRENSGVDPHVYFEYAAYNHILSMSFEGPLYHSINYSGRFLDEFNAIFKKFGLYYELGNSWNLTAYPIDEMEVEYTKYNKPKERIFLYKPEIAPKELGDIMRLWYALSEATGDKGCCVLGAGFEFDWRGDKYKMTSCSPWQGSISWETHVDTIKRHLEEVGATDIRYDWGSMD